jgi:hypothetical protein
MATPIALFVSLEVTFIDALRRLGLLATVWYWTFVAVLWMESVIYIATEIVRATKPRASANEDALSKPLWAVVARGSTAMRSGVIVSVGTFRGYADVDADLSFRFRDGYRETASSNCGQHYKF